MKIDEKIEKHLDEAVNIADEVRGLKKWLDDFEDACDYGNWKLSHSLLKDIETELKKLKKSIQ